MEMTNSKYARWLKSILLRNMLTSCGSQIMQMKFYMLHRTGEVRDCIIQGRTALLNLRGADALIRIGERGYSADVVVGTKGNSGNGSV